MLVSLVKNLKLNQNLWGRILKASLRESAGIHVGYGAKEKKVKWKATKRNETNEQSEQRNE